ncbi:TetR/AcrR family transcriptional regulator [Lentilactobacillus kosonis]|uniref:Transcriptional regulator, TetR family n=1 Tax=Lentilactobacillus kosonis TaxID=2810561 RepID=A0A401FHR2_9LACO|nr:TetR/AcrR family transcriptional regulator C-terminal ligand-binding domain-containing protein [Lentilactobacillus kosonis]GAY71889.1 transcriptional regulator, TetR family [Lentilactobacillus kosonis]
MTKTRRRGSELEDAIFSAALDIIDNEGLENLTFQKVAEAAQTSKPVIYRRWDTPFELAINAAQDRIRKNNQGSLSDYVLTGDSIRADLIQLMNRFMISVNFIGENLFRRVVFQLSSDESSTIQRYITDSLDIDRQAIDNTLARAKKRGELVKDNLTDDTKYLPFELIRYHIMVQDEVNDELITSLVDNILLPLYLE